MKMPVVLVLGGGFSGAVFTAHLLRAARGPVQVSIVEPRPSLGAGLAYGSASFEHRINVPSDKMTVFREDPTHLTRWVRAAGLFESDADAVTAGGSHYTRRVDFARYIGALLEEAQAGAPSGTIVRHVRAEAIEVATIGSRYSVRLDDDMLLEGDAVVVTTSCETPAFPWPADERVQSFPGLVRDPWTQLASLDIESMSCDSTIVIAGTGLTMCDAFVSLAQRGFQGRVLAISRRGLLPRPHGSFRNDFDLLSGQPLPVTARSLLRLIREAVSRSDDWREPLDAVRFKLPSLWQALAPHERKRAVRFLRSFWDVHRFRMAPQVAGLLRRHLDRDELSIVAGRISAISSEDAALTVHWHERKGTTRHTRCAAFVNCTGPSANPAHSENPLIRSLLARSLAVVDSTGMGLACDAEGRLRGSDGTFADRLCVAGPLARAAVAEVTGVPEASAHARRVAERFASDRTFRWESSRAELDDREFSP